MRYRIELKYFYGWDDAGWSIETNAEMEPLRFPSLFAAQAALDDFVRAIKTAVTTGDMDREADRADYRIAESID